MKIRVVNEPDVDAALDAAIRKTLVACFPLNEAVFSTTRRWRGNEPFYSVIAVDNETVCSHIAVVDRTILVGEEVVRVSGVGNVCALPEYRKTGLSDKMLRIAMEEAGYRTFDLGLLFTSEKIKGFYGRNGWLEITARKFVKVENEDEVELVLPDESIKMYYPLDREEFPTGDVHLQGDKW